jgi:quercetin dioxygenase-like cupin family protein
MDELIKPFVFDDFAELDMDTIKNIQIKGNIDVRDWAYALKGYKEEVQAAVFASLADTVSEAVYEMQWHIGLIYTSEAVEAQERIVCIVRNILENGGINIKRNDTMGRFFYDGDLSETVVEPGKLSRKVKAHSGNVMVVEVSFANGAVGEPHSHPHEQIAYCLEGEFEFTVSGVTNVIKAGDSVYVPPNAVHGCKPLPHIAAGKLLDVFTPAREDFLQ